MKHAASRDGGASKRRATDQDVPIVRLRSVLGLALERYRLQKGLGLNELARLAEIDPAQLSRLEGGHQVSAHASTLRKLAGALDLNVEHLVRLREVSRRFVFTTATPDGASAAVENAEEFSPVDISVAIEEDPTIPPERKKWLHDCVALVRRAGGLGASTG